MNEEFLQYDIFGNAVVVIPDALEEESDLVGPKTRSEFNIFALTDAVGARNKREAWVLYHKALSSGLSAEEIFFKVFWQIKTMLLALCTKTAEEADMKTFPYGKAKGFLKNWQSGELERFSQMLVDSYQQARRGRGEMETSVEKILLNF